MKKNWIKRAAQASAKELYKRCKPHMMQRFGRILSYEEFCATLQTAGDQGKLDDFRKRQRPFTVG